MRVHMGGANRAGQLEEATVKDGIGRFYRLMGRPPRRVLVRPGCEGEAAATVKGLGLGLAGVKVEAGTCGILAGEMWME